MTGGDHGGSTEPGRGPDRVDSLTTSTAELPVASVLASFAHLGVMLERHADVGRYLDLAADVAARLMHSTSLAVVLVDDGRPHHVAFSPNDATFVPWVVRESDGGPWIDAVSAGVASVCNVDDIAPHLTGFGRRARAIGVTSCATFPLTCPRDADTASADRCPGALVVLRLDATPWDECDLDLGTSLASVIAAQLQQHDAVVAATRRAHQLQVALDSRVVIEQAKGMVAAVVDVSVGVAFELLRSWARRHRRTVHDVAADIVERRLSARVLLDDIPPTNSRADDPRSTRDR